MITPDFLEGLKIFGLAIVPALFGVICHEVAHGWMAYKQGDPTAKQLGRLTLNPLPHIDPMGLGMFVFTALFTRPFIIGWAKPVPVQPGYFKHPREGMVFVSLAGPMANFMVALLCAVLIKLLGNLASAGIIAYHSEVYMLLRTSLGLGVIINCALAWFNLCPVPPLDGSHIVGGLMPEKLYRAYASIGRYGMLIIILLLVSGVLGRVVGPLIRQTVGLFESLLGIAIW